VEPSSECTSTGPARQGTHNQAIGRSRGGLTIVALVDALSCASSCCRARQRGGRPASGRSRFRRPISGQDGDALRADLNNRGAVAVIPPRVNRAADIPCDFKMYKWRHLVENFFCKIKEFCRIATRYDKTDTSFSAMIQLVGAVLAT
jgi:transposase